MITQLEFKWFILIATNKETYFRLNIKFSMNTKICMNTRKHNQNLWESFTSFPIHTFSGDLCFKGIDGPWLINYGPRLI